MPNLRRFPLLISLAACLGLFVSACENDEVGQTCATLEEARACADGEGTQFCFDDNVGMGAAELVWSECLVDFECMPGETRSCGFDEPEFANLTETCSVMGGVPYWNENSCETPLVLSFEGGPIEMTASSAEFDISGAGACVSTDWPAARNPWLAIDLDKNGFIDGGHELFGSGSILGSGAHASNGFIALETFDSNRDGKVDAADARFDELLVWRDEDGDKQSLPWELSTLSEAGVYSLDLAYTNGEQCDARGNCGRERSSFEFAAGGERRVGELVDVYLACQ